MLNKSRVVMIFYEIDKNDKIVVYGKIFDEV
jgi:hypothetical protein